MKAKSLLIAVLLGATVAIPAAYAADQRQSVNAVNAQQTKSDSFAARRAEQLRAESDAPGGH